MSFEMECGLPAHSADAPECRNPVFVSGLARSGTTALLQVLYGTGEFESLTYRDMPFVLMPQLWARMTRSLYKVAMPAERAHADSILVDFDSPESFECVFWRTFSGDSYDSGDCLLPYEPEDEVLEKFRRYISVIATRTPGPPRRYLSKNNNNLIRLAAIQRALPGAGILVLYRDPLQTAASSFRQHLRFCEAQRNDPFILQYMDMLEHHEFGLAHKPFRFDAGQRQSLLPVDPNYWLAYWIEVYDHLLGTEIPFRFVSHERLCVSPVLALRQLFTALGIESDPEPFAASLRLAPTGSLPDFDERLIERSRAIHQQLYSDRRNVVCLN